MNILICGDLLSLTTSLSKAFSKEKHRVVIAGSTAKNIDPHLSGVTVHAAAPTDPFFEEIVSAYKFNAVVYLGVREEHLLEQDQQNSGQVLDGLLKALRLCKKQGIDQLFYISSTEVFGTQSDTADETEPQPVSPNGFNLLTGEQYCKYYSEHFELTTTVVRVPFVYGPDENNSFLSRVIQQCKEKKQLLFPAGQNAPCGLLNAMDVADFILRALDESYTGYQVVNLAPAEAITFAHLAELLQKYFPEVQIGYDENAALYTRPAALSNAKKMYDWIAEHRLAADLEKMIDSESARQPSRFSWFDRLKIRFPKYRLYIQWSEVLLGAAAMTFLNDLSGALIEFRYVDFRLIYVVLMGSIYGTQAGLIASLLAGVSLIISWNRLGMDWTELVYNVANWLPFAVYLTAGAITGYLQDKKENNIKSQNQQNYLIQEKYKYLYELYQQVCEIKNQFHKQLVGSRDSFGRIFNIAQELDTLEEEEVLFKAVNVLEDVMDNQSIAIYSINHAKGFARLEVHSSMLNGCTPKSLNLPDLPDLLDCVAKGEIYQNTRMQPNYPAYFAPIRNGTTTIAAVAIWNAGFDQYSLYYFNLFKVVCGLIQSSLNRVTLFMDASIDKLYLPYTRIMHPEPFKKVLSVKNRVKKNKAGDHLLVRVCLDHSLDNDRDWQKLYGQVSAVIRQEDYLGLLDDGNCYILFSQADQASAAAIYQRLERHGINYEPVKDSHALLQKIVAIIPVYDNINQVQVNLLRG